jgi:hypothetical protein
VVENACIVSYTLARFMMVQSYVFLINSGASGVTSSKYAIPQ